jgi:y4mF family transcriptional regulator
MIMHERNSFSAGFAMDIGSAVKLERDRLELTQDELAFAAGVSTRVVHQIEHGKETSRLDKVSAVLGALGLTLQVIRDQDRAEAEAQ